MLDHTTSVGLEAGHGAADVGVYLDDLFDRGGFEEGGGYALFDAKENAMGGGDLRASISALFFWSCRRSSVSEKIRRTPMAVEPSLMASKEYST